MVELFRTPVAFAIEPKSVSRIRNWALFLTRLIFWPIAFLALVALALELGAYRKEFKIAGPFAEESDPARHSLILTVPQEGRAPWWRQPLLGDDNEHPHRSVLQLWIDEHKVGPPHSQHETIRNGRTDGFSHWGPNLIFSLPPGVTNATGTTATLRYSVFPRAWVTFALVIASALFGWFAYDRALRSPAQRYGEPAAAIVIRAPYLIMLGLCRAGLIGSAVYVASSLYALTTGWALPTTALIRWSPVAEWAARNEPYLGYLLLTCAGFGTIVTWLAGLNSQHRRSVEADERRLRGLLLWCGLPIAACAFVFCISAMWVGIVRPSDPNPLSIGGLIPFSDAHSHLAASYDQARDGTWIAFAQRRPLASAFRSVLLFFSNFSLPVMLILQACLLAAAACFAAYRVAIWRGIWAAIAFFGLTYIYARFFVPTVLTEPLGLFWALVSIPFFIEAFRDRAVKPALVAFAMTTVALMTRMGSMFTVPALLVWLVWQFGHGTVAKLKIGAVALGILFGVFGLNSLLQKAYGTNEGATGSNFAHVLCGLSLGTSWEGCIEKLALAGKSMPAEEGDLTKLLYSMAQENFRAEPGVFFRRIANGAGEFITRFPDVIWKGYRSAIEEEPNWLSRNVLTTICLAGLLYVATHRAKSVELTFWTLQWGSIVASSSIVYFDDGPRTLAASHPLIALFFAMGLSNPILAPTKAPSLSRLSRFGSLGLILAAALFVCVPWMAHRFSPVSALGGNSLVPKRDEVFVLGGRRMSGFLVVDNNQPLRNAVASLHLADFEAIIEQTGLEFYQGLLHPVTPPLPFGFVFAPRLEKGTFSSDQFIVPADVIERRNVPAWHFQLKRWGYKPGGYGEYWFYVTKAEPWP